MKCYALLWFVMECYGFFHRQENNAPITIRKIRKA